MAVSETKTNLADVLKPFYQRTSEVLLPAKVVQALNLNLEGTGAQAQFGPRFNGSFVTYSDAAVRVPHDNLLSHQKQQRNSSRPQPAMNKEVRLPQEWTY